MPTPLPATGTALLLIDVQQALFQPAPRPHEADAVIARINALAAQARAAGVPVLWVQHETVPGHRLAHGSPGWALADGLQVGMAGALRGVENESNAAAFEQATDSREVEFETREPVDRRERHGAHIGR